LARLRGTTWGRWTSALRGGAAERVLGHLATDRNLYASALNHALSAPGYWFRRVPERPRDEPRYRHAQRPPRVPMVLSRDEARALLGELTGTPRLLARLL
jgi:hypothetical protein